MLKKVKHNNSAIKKSSKKDRFVVLLENVRDEIKLVAEGNLILQEKMDSGFEEVNGRIDSLKNKIDIVKEDLDAVKEDIIDVREDLGAMKEDLNSVKEEMRMGFKTLIAESVDDENKFAAKADKKDLILLEKRVGKLETAK